MLIAHISPLRLMTVTPRMHVFAALALGLALSACDGAGGERHDVEARFSGAFDRTVFVTGTAGIDGNIVGTGFALGLTLLYDSEGDSFQSQIRFGLRIPALGAYERTPDTTATQPFGGSIFFGSGDNRRGFGIETGTIVVAACTPRRLRGSFDLDLREFQTSAPARLIGQFDLPRENTGKAVLEPLEPCPN